MPRRRRARTRRQRPPRCSSDVASAEAGAEDQWETATFQSLKGKPEETATFQPANGEPEETPAAPAEARREEEAAPAPPDASSKGENVQALPAAPLRRCESNEAQRIRDAYDTAVQNTDGDDLDDLLAVLDTEA